MDRINWNNKSPKSSKWPKGDTNSGPPDCESNAMGRGLRAYTEHCTHHFQHLMRNNLIDTMIKIDVILSLCHIVELPFFTLPLPLSMIIIIMFVCLFFLFYFIYLFIFTLSGSSPVFIVNGTSAVVAK